MHTITAYARREALSDDELERLKQALADEVFRYQEAIRGYAPDKMEQFGKPHLAELKARVSEVERLQARRAGK